MNKKIAVVAKTDLMTLLRQEVISSREIAGYAGKEHYNVLRDIKVVEEQLADEKQEDIAALKFEGSTYKDRSGKKNPECLLNKEACLLLVSGYNLSVRLKIQNRWLELENLVREQKRTADALVEARLSAAMQFKDQCEAVQEKYRALGREAEPYHYMAEAKLLWFLISGKFKRLDREDMTPELLDLLTRMEKMNATLIRMGIKYDNRKDRLREYVVTGYPELSHMAALFIAADEKATQEIKDEYGIED